MAGNSGKTAMVRKGPSAPMKWITTKYMVWPAGTDDGLLDYGCGRGADADYLNCVKYDPKWFPTEPNGKFHTIFCTYVLNTLTEQEAHQTLCNIQALMYAYSYLFVTVRRDIKQEGMQLGGSYQRNVVLDTYPIDGLVCQSIRKTSGYEIYLITRRND